ncbi:MAG: sugar phosphate isomerase/epimerase [Clostridia bacterium]|nr:sugar phosphate isomerase/epimerase [Clostridia bacterium]
MQIGISTSCLYPLPTDEALLRLAQMDVREVEIFFNAGCETRGSLLRELCAIREAYGIRVQAVHPYFSFAESYTLFGIYPRRVQDAMELYKGLCEACRALDCDKLVLHGEKEPFSLSAQAYIERFAALAEQTRGDGVLLTQENVVRFRAAEPGFLRQMRQELGDLFAMTLDVKQAARSGVDPLSLAREFAPQIAHLHLSDHGPGGDCLPPGTGAFDFRALFATLYTNGFSGDGVLELYSSCFDQKDILPSCARKLQEFSEI